MENTNTAHQTLALTVKHVSETQDVTPKAAKKRPVIYDDEIGLWEELENKYRQKIAKVSNAINQRLFTGF